MLVHAEARWTIFLNEVVWAGELVGPITNDEDKIRKYYLQRNPCQQLQQEFE